MLRRYAAAVLAVYLLVVATPLSAQTALDAISSDAGVVIRVKSPKAGIEKIAELVDQIVPGQGELVRLQGDGIGAMISNPAMAGVDKESDWWVAAYPRAGGQEPSFVFVVPGTDLKAMKEGLGDSVKFAEHGKFGVYTEDADAFDKTTALLKGTGNSIGKLIDQDSLAVFDKGDVSVFLHVTRLVTVYKAEITEWRERLMQQLENVPAEVPGQPGVNPKAMADVFGGLLNTVMSGLQDVESCTIAMMISKEGLSFEDLVRVASNSKTDALLQKSPPNAMTGVGSLPASGLGFFGLHGDLSDLMQLGIKMSVGMMGSGEEAAKGLEAAMADMQKLKYGLVASSFGLGSIDEGALRTVTITEVSEPTKLRDLSQKLFKSFGTMQSGGLKQTYELQPAAEKVGQLPVDVLTLKMEADDAGNPGVESMIRFMKALYGPEGMTTRTVYLKDKAVQSGNGGKDALAKALAAVEKDLEAIGGTTAFKQARAGLNDKANLLLLFDLPGTIVKALEVAVEGGLVPIPLNPEMLKALELKPSYLGLSVSTESRGLRTRTVIPVEQAQGVAKIVMMFIGQFNAGGQ